MKWAVFDVTLGMNKEFQFCETEARTLGKGISLRGNATGRKLPKNPPGVHLVQMWDRSFTGFSHTASPPRVLEHMAASGSMALSKLRVHVTHSPGYLLLTRMIWKKDLDAFKTQSNVLRIAEDSRDMSCQSWHARWPLFC